LEKKQNIYVYNRIKAAQLELSKDESYLISRLVGLENNLVNGDLALEKVATQLFNIFTQPSPELDLDRVCVAITTPYSNRLHVLSSHNSPALGGNTMEPGYNCFVAPNTSLLQIQESDLRICSSLGDVVQNYQRENKPVQRSLGRLFTMGVRSGLTIRASLGDIAVGYLFLNSRIVGRFDHLENWHYLAVCTLKLLLKSILLQHFQGVLSPSEIPTAKRKVHEGAKDLVTAEQVAGEVQHQLAERLGESLDFTWDANFKEAILFPQQSFLFLHSQIALSQYNFGSLPKLKVSFQIQPGGQTIVVTTSFSSAPQQASDFEFLDVASIFHCKVGLSEREFSLEYDLDKGLDPLSKVAYSI